MPRLSHSDPNIRKKTVVALYRLALVYPDTLRPAWPKIKDILMDDEENSSVTAATINVVCELGWRRPRDFLPLAPRLFELLVDGGNNWMAIKIIKLVGLFSILSITAADTRQFATLTPLEPRLVKKLLPPLTNLIRSTPAMSLLYECINGIIQGGILESTDGEREGEEIASLCVGKLRSMIEVEDDPNCKFTLIVATGYSYTTLVRYVALLAFNRIVTSHAYLVSMHQDAILSCIDDPDISIRLQALDLGAGMVSSDNLVAVVERLMRQLRSAPLLIADNGSDRRHSEGILPAADSDGEDPAATLRPIKGSMNDAPPLPAEYRISIIRRILDMCSKDTYANLSDFEWYIETLAQLVKLVPPLNKSFETAPHGHDFTSGQGSLCSTGDISETIGSEFQNVAVRVSTVRAEAVNVVASLMVVDGGKTTLANIGDGGEGVLRSGFWIVGEYADHLLDPSGTLTNAIHAKTESLAPQTICAYLQAIPKILILTPSLNNNPWTPERKSMTSLLIARITHFLENLTTHPSLEVQERCVELLELMRLASQAVIDHDLGSEHGPLLLTKAIPSLYIGDELKPVAPTAQKKVPSPNDLDLDIPINDDLAILLQQADYDDQTDPEFAEFESFYNVRSSRKPITSAAIDTLPSIEPEPHSYQQIDNALDPNALSKKRQERRARNKDDPFYIASDNNNSGSSTPFLDILRNTNGEDVNVDSIPIMDLDLGDKFPGTESSDPEPRKPQRRQPKKRHIAMDENIDLDDTLLDRTIGARTSSSAPPSKSGKAKKSPLEVDSSGLGTFSLDDNDEGSQLDVERREMENADMAKALADVERLRMEMQRANERVQAEGVPPEGDLVKKRKKKRKDVLRNEEGAGEGLGHDREEAVVKKKKKKKKQAVAIQGAEEEAGDG